jgi:hypothetical protein
MLEVQMDYLTLGAKSYDDVRDMEIRNAIIEAKKEADKHGAFFSSGFSVTEDLANKIVQRKKQDYFPAFTRDKYAHTSAAKILFEVLLEALFLEYKITEDEVQGKLCDVAVLMHSKGYQPMQVMGATVEGIKIIPK